MPDSHENKRWNTWYDIEFPRLVRHLTCRWYYTVDIESVVHDAMIAYHLRYECNGEFKSDSERTAILNRIANRMASRIVRVKAGRKQKDFTLLQEMTQTVNELEIDARIERGPAEQFWARLRNLLSVQQWYVIEARYLYGKTYSQIAHELDMSKQAVKNISHRARCFLADLLNEDGKIRSDKQSVRGAKQRA